MVKLPSSAIRVPWARESVRTAKRATARIRALRMVEQYTITTRTFEKDQRERA
jgi:hypothetical protein